MFRFNPKPKTKAVFTLLLILAAGLMTLVISPAPVAAGTVCCQRCESGNPDHGACYCNENDATGPKCPSGGTGCGCCGGNCGGGGCSKSAPTAPGLSAPANGAVNLTNPVTFSWTANSSQWGKGCSDSRNFRFLYKEKVGATCTTSGFVVAGGNMGENVRSTTRNIFEYGKTYCWRIQRRNNDQVANSAIREFTMAHPPVLVGSGFLNNNVCSTASSGRSVHNTTNNPITYYTDYQDVDSNFGAGINRLTEARVAMLPVQNQNGAIVQFNVIDTDIPLRSTAGFGVDLTNLNSPQFFSLDAPAIRIGSGNLSNASGTATLLDLSNPGNPRSTRVEILNNNTVRIYWEIRFNDSFASANINMYNAGMIDVNGVRISQDAAPTVPLNYGKGIMWKTDLKDPIVDVSTFPVSVDSFGVNWDFNATDDTIVGPGNPLVLRSYCYSSAEPLSIFATSMGGQEILISDVQPNPHSDPGNCLVTAANWGSHTYRVQDINSLGDVQFAMYGQDAACNPVVDDGTLQSPTPWAISSRSTTSAGGGYRGFKVRNLDLSDIVPDLGENDSYLSTYSSIAGTEQMVIGRESKADYVVTRYSDLSLTPPSISGTSNWYEYLLELVARSYTISDLATTQIGGQFSSVYNVTPGSSVFVRYLGDLTINSGAVCNVRGVIFVAGNVTINPNLTRVGDSGCVIIAQGNIRISQGSRSNPPSKAFTQTSTYDEVQAFLVANGTYITDNDQFGNSEVPDAVLLKGGLYATQVDLGRSLGAAHNGLQPAEVFIYDPFYEATFRDIFATRTFSLRAR